MRKGIGDISLGTLECREEGVGVAAVGPRAQNGHLIIHLFDLQSYGLIPWSHIQSFTIWSQIQGLTIWSPIQLLTTWSQSQGLTTWSQRQCLTTWSQSQRNHMITAPVSNHLVIEQGCEHQVTQTYKSAASIINNKLNYAFCRYWNFKITSKYT